MASRSGSFALALKARVGKFHPSKGLRKKLPEKEVLVSETIPMHVVNDDLK